MSSAYTPTVYSYLFQPLLTWPEQHSYSLALHPSNLACSFLLSDTVAEFFNIIGTTFLRVFLLAIHSHLYKRILLPSPPPPLLSKNCLKMACIVNSVYWTLKAENSQDYAQKPQRSCTFMNSAYSHIFFVLPGGRKFDRNSPKRLIKNISRRTKEAQNLGEFVPKKRLKGTLVWTEGIQKILKFILLFTEIFEVLTH
jgi:hypothetical protein